MKRKSPEERSARDSRRSPRTHPREHGTRGEVGTTARELWSPGGRKTSRVNGGIQKGTKEGKVEIVDYCTLLHLRETGGTVG